MALFFVIFSASGLHGPSRAGHLRTAPPELQAVPGGYTALLPHGYGIEHGRIVQTRTAEDATRVAKNTTNSTDDANMSAKNETTSATSGTVNGNVNATSAKDAPAAGMRVAHCLPGQMRTLCSSFMYENYRKNAIDPVEAHSDVFLILQSADRRPFENLAECRKAYDGLRVKHVTYTDKKRIWKWESCKAEIDKFEKIGGFRYTHVIKARPDVFIASPLPALAKLPRRGTMWVLPYLEMADGPRMVGELSEGSQRWYHEFLTRKKNDYGVNDIFFITDRDSADGILMAASLRKKRIEEEANLTAPNRPSVQQCSRGTAKSDECALKMAAISNNVEIQYMSFIVRILRPCGWKFGPADYDMGKLFNSVCLWDLMKSTSSEALHVVQNYGPLRCPLSDEPDKPFAIEAQRWAAEWAANATVRELCGGRYLEDGPKGPWPRKWRGHYDSNTYDIDIPR